MKNIFLKPLSTLFIGLFLFSLPFISKAQSIDENGHHYTQIKSVYEMVALGFELEDITLVVNGGTVNPDQFNSDQLINSSNFSATARAKGRKGFECGKRGGCCYFHADGTGGSDALIIHVKIPDEVDMSSATNQIREGNLYYCIEIDEFIVR